ncbi:udp-glycosyltransferase 79b30 [Quercus suber]|uniref:Udp-glycosyltransferase 79b30 n=1 Tax=Quercus suber TaxID=58331 RepID=A0AAW0L3S3_QUESU
MEGPYCDYVERQFKKPVILAGPVVPEPPIIALEEKWARWLDSFKPKTVIFCAFGSMPFLAALKPPMGTETIEFALPEGFEERVKGRGVVHGDWVQQQLILRHPSVGCFVTHCGSGSLSEAMVTECQMVLLPSVGDQIINARLMGRDFKVGVEVKKGEEDGLFTREGVCKAVRAVMDEVLKIVRWGKR